MSTTFNITIKILCLILIHVGVLNANNLQVKETDKSINQNSLPAVKNEALATTLPTLNTVKDDSSIIKEIIAPILQGTLLNADNSVEKFTAKTTQSLAQGKNAEEIIQDNIGNVYKNAQGLLSKEVNTAINNQVKNILGQFGKAEVNLSLNDKGNLERYDFSVFSSLYDEKQHLIFTQNALRKQGANDEERTVGNFGLGYRYFPSNKEYALGVNSFIDHDFSGSNTRMSLGAEYWRNYLKLSTNYYLPLSNWKNSTVLKGYDERPARGYDIRMQGYLPSNPHFGGSLVFEQYQGDEVALFDKDKLQKNPIALTAGLDYTPIPLVTFSAEHKIGEDSQEQTLINMQMNLKMGVPLEEQLKPENVALDRNLMGSRYDLVDRNNEIVFEYQKQSFDVKITPQNHLLPFNGVEYRYYLNDLINVIASNNSKIPIKSVRWVITPAFNQETRFSNESNLQFDALSTGTFYVTLYLTNEIGVTAKSNTVMIQVIDDNSNYIATLGFLQRTDKDAGLFDFNRNGQLDRDGGDVDIKPNLSYLFLEEIPKDVPEKLTNQYFHLTVDVENITGEEIDLRDAGDKIQLSYFSNDKTVILTENKGKASEELVILKKYPDAEKINRWHFILATSSFDLFIESTAINGIPIVADVHIADERVQSNKDKFFLNYLSTDGASTDPLLQIKLYERGQDGSVNGGIVLDTGGMQRRLIRQNIKLDTYYEVKVFETVITEDENGNPTWFTAEITPEVQDTIVWHYFNPEEEKPVGVTNTNDNYYGLEACHGYTMFSTQVNNFLNNELSWGAIGKEYIQKASAELDKNSTLGNNMIKLTEQNLQLEVQFDISQRKREREELNKDMIICEDEIPASSEYYELMIQIADINPKENEKKPTNIHAHLREK